MTHQGLRITPESMAYRDTAYLKICTHGGRDEFSDLFRRTREVSFELKKKGEREILIY